MKRKAIDPWEWGPWWSMHQGELVEGLTRTLHCSGQVSLAPDPDSEMGIAVVHADDRRGQIQTELANITRCL